MKLLQEANELLAEAHLDDVAYEVADAMDISFGDALRYIDTLAYVIAAGTKIGKSKILQAIVAQMEKDPDIVDRLANVGMKREELKKMADDIKDKRSWASSISFFRRTQLLPSQMLDAMEGMWD